MKILWISNVNVLDECISSTGTWVIAMYETLQNTCSGLEIINMFPASSIKKPIKIIKGDVIQYKIPIIEQNSEQTVEKVIEIIKELDVDLIQVWGTENGWAFHIINSSISIPVLVDIQGIMSTVKENYLGGIDLLKLFKTLSVRDILRYKTSLFNLNQFLDIIKKENYVINSAHYLSYPSDWVKKYLLLRNKRASLFKSHLLLRKEFYNSIAWDSVAAYKSMSIVVISAFSYPLKGGHILLKALAILKRKYPNVELRIVGRVPSKWRCSSYDRYIRKEIKKMRLTTNVKWYGALESNQLIELLKSSTLFVCPSYVESYSLATAEATMIGIPVITAHTGALPEFMPTGTKSFPIGDYNQLASEIEYIFDNQDVALKISEQEKCGARIRHDKTSAAQSIMRVYEEIISKQQ